MKRRFFVRLIVLLSAATFVASCGAINSISKGISDATGSVERNLLTGLPGINQKIIAVKVDDTRAAHPQVGVESADVVYIEQVEGGLTRLIALYSSFYPVKVGPVRSARISDIDILAEYGRVGFIFSGAQRKMYPVIDSANLANLGAQRNPATVYVRDNLRYAPTNLFVYPEKLLQTDPNADSIDEVGDPGWTFGDNPGIGKEIKSATVKWPAATYKVSWSNQEDRWILDFNGQPNLTPEGYQLGSPTFVIQLVEISPSEFGDRYGGVTPKHHVVGQGRGYILRDGQAIEAIWSRPTLESKTEWKLLDGSDAHFEPGQIWIALTNNEPIFEELPKETGKTGTK